MPVTAEDLEQEYQEEQAKRAKKVQASAKAKMNQVSGVPRRCKQLLLLGVSCALLMLVVRQGEGSGHAQGELQMIHQNPSKLEEAEIHPPLQNLSSMHQRENQLERRVPPVVRRLSSDLARTSQQQASFFCKVKTKSFATKCDHSSNGRIALAALSTLLKNQVPHRDLGVVVGGMNTGMGLKLLLQDLGELGKEHIHVVGFDIFKQFVEASTKLLQELGYRFSVFHKGMSDRGGTVCSIPPKEGQTGRGKVSVAGGAGEKNRCEAQVNLTTIEDITSSVGIKHTIYVLIDTEGHDLSVIFGMGLEKIWHKYPVIQFELGAPWCKPEAYPSNFHKWRQAEASQYLHDLGYNLYIMGCEEGDRIGRNANDDSELMHKAPGGCLFGPLMPPMMDLVNCKPWIKCTTGNMLIVHQSLASKEPMGSTLASLINSGACKL